MVQGMSELNESHFLKRTDARLSHLLYLSHPVCQEIMSILDLGTV